MAVKQVQKSRKSQARARKEIMFPLRKGNWVIIAIGIVFLIVGYIFMAENSVDGFLPTIVAPILLVLGYCVVIPYGILKKPSAEKKIETIPEDTQNVTTSAASRNVSTNIKTS
jgi:hypothetical protein